MLNIEVIRFEAQDVITASVAAPVKPACNHEWDGTMVGAGNGYASVVCKHCGTTGLYKQGTSWSDPSSFTWND